LPTGPHAAGNYISILKRLSLPASVTVAHLHLPIAAGGRVASVAGAAGVAGVAFRARGSGFGPGESRRQVSERQHTKWPAMSGTYRSTAA